MYLKSSPQTIQKMFSSIAEDYDRANGVLSFSLHKLWNRRLVREIFRRKEITSLLDLCAGTAEIGLLALSEKKKPEQIVFVDFCKEMLEVAKKKCRAVDHDDTEFSFICSDAQDIPLDDGQFDAITISYGIRNVEDPKKCFKECKRLLRQDGILAILELTEPANGLLRKFHSFYLKNILPKLGQLIAKDKKAYEYLSSSIQSFTKPYALKGLLEETGFEVIAIKEYTFGAATCFLCKKTSKLRIGF